MKRASASNKNLAYCAVIHSIADAVGRAGEALPQTYGDWSHDYKWNATNSWWKEKKTLQKYAMPRVADEHWYMDWYMFMAMYCLIDNGLYRTPKQIDDGQLLTVFPFLHGKSDSYCAEKITNVIRSALPEAVREQFSSKSLRQAGISTCSLHPFMTLFYLCGLSGHATNTSDSYLDNNDIGRAMPGVNALHGKKNLHTPAVTPSLDALGVDKDCALRLMDEIFQCNIPKFEEGEELYVLREIMLASLLMHHRQLIKDCSAVNIVSSTLLDAARRINITCSDSSGLPSDQVVRRWSECIEKDFQERSTLARLSVMDESGKEMYVLVASLLESIRELKRSNESLIGTVNGLTTKFDQVVRQHTDDAVTISNLLGRDELLRRELESMTMRDVDKIEQLITTPDGGVSRKGRRYKRRKNKSPSPSLNGEEGEDSLVDGASAVAADRSGPVGNGVEARAATALPSLMPVTTNPRTDQAGGNVGGGSRHVNVRLQFGHAAQEVASGAASSMEKKMFAALLIDMAWKGRFRLQSQLSKAVVPNNIKEKHFVRTCLELADFVGSDADVKADIEILRQANSRTDKRTLDDSANRIQAACMKELSEMVPPMTKRPLVASISGMGARIKTYKQLIKDAKKSDADISKINIISLEELERIKQT